MWPSGVSGAAPGARCQLASKDTVAWEAWLVGRQEGPQSGNSSAGRVGPGTWPLVAVLLRERVCLCKYHPCQNPSPPQNITSPCFALSGHGESLSTDVILRVVGPLGKPASRPRRAALEGAALLCRALYFFHVGEKNPDFSYSTDPKGQIFAVCPAFSISGRGGGNSWLLGRTMEDPAGRSAGLHSSSLPPHPPQPPSPAAQVPVHYGRTRFPGDWRTNK